MRGERDGAYRRARDPRSRSPVYTRPAYKRTPGYIPLTARKRPSARVCSPEYRRLPARRNSPGYTTKSSRRPREPRTRDSPNYYGSQAPKKCHLFRPDETPRTSHEESRDFRSHRLSQPYGKRHVDTDKHVGADKRVDEIPDSPDMRNDSPGMRNGSPDMRSEAPGEFCIYDSLSYFKDIKKIGEGAFGYVSCFARAEFS